MKILSTLLLCVLCLHAFAGDVISCAPEATKAQKESKLNQVTTIKAGLWADKSIWSTGKLPDSLANVVIAHDVTINISTQVLTVTVNPFTTLTFAPEKVVRLSQDRSMKVLGTLVMKPTTGKNILRFTNIDESKVQGTVPNGGMGMGIPSTDADPEELDPGLWVLGAGKLDLKGTDKTPWTHAAGSVMKGATSYTVEDATGWKVGDQIVIVPTDKPGQYTTDWNDATGQLTDNFAPKFEIRTIQRISGKTVYFYVPLKFDHLAISSNAGKESRNWKPEVINLTRNVVITGTKDAYNGKGYEWQTNHRAHILINSTTPQNIRFVEGRFLGQERVGDRGRPEVITGRYGLHFHMNGDGSRGSIVEGCSFWNIGNRVYVPHESHGITFENNTAYNSFGESFWWDQNTLSHEITYNHNLAACVRGPGGGGLPGFLLGQGDDNKATNNVVIYAGASEKGGYAWIADNEGVWGFINNLAHSCDEGLNVWQNTSNLHEITNYDSYNCRESIFHGAYANGYIYYGGYHYNSPINLNAAGAQFIRVHMDAAGLPYAVGAQDSPVMGSICLNNPFIQCVFRNYTTAAVELRSVHPLGHVDQSIKIIDLIDCDIPGRACIMNPNEDYPLREGNAIRVQPTLGQTIRALWQNGREVINNYSVFAPHVWGVGTGLKAEYYNGNNFNEFAFSRIEATPRLAQASYDPYLTPTGVHYKIRDNRNFSIRWSGQLEAQYNESYTFSIEGNGVYRLTVNGQVLIDENTPKDASSVMTYSKPIALKGGQKYNIKLEHRAINTIATCKLKWQSPSMDCMREVPVTQLYPESGNRAQRLATPETKDISQKRDISATPNPVQRTTIIRYPILKGAGQIVITNSMGVVVKNLAAQGTSVTADLSSLPAGIYSYTLYADGKIFSNKLIKQ